MAHGHGLFAASRRKQHRLPPRVKIMNEQELLIILRQAFAEESAERLTAINAMMLDLEKAGLATHDRGVMEKVYREFHSLKGAARAVNYNQIETICQAVEGIFSLLKQGATTISPELFETLLEAITCIETIVAAPEPTQCPVAQERILALLNTLEARSAAQGVSATATTPPGGQEAMPPPVATTTQPLPSPQQKAHCQGQPPQPRDSNAPLAAPAPSPPSPTEHEVQAPPPAAKGSAERQIRVDTAKLGSLLLHAEEMIALKLTGSRHLHDLKQVSQTVDLWREKWRRADKQLRQLRKEAQAMGAGNASDAPPYTPEIWRFLEWANDFISTLGQDIKTLGHAQEQNHRALTRMVDELLDEAKGVVMQPCATMLSLFPKMVREIAKQQKKEVELRIHGGEIEVDRRILERIKDPLVHLLRNAVDHGIEYPDARQAKGKPAQGTITVKVSQMEGDKVEILVADDGPGLDLAKIRESAMATKVVGKEQMQDIDDRQAAALIFASGVSAAPIVTELSGRGLGMAIVQEAVEELAGVLSLENRPGHGVGLTMRLPVSMSTFRGVLVQVGAELFILPSSQVVAVLKLKREQLKTVENRTTFPYQGKPLSLVGLDEVLGLTACGAKQEESLKVVVLASAALRMGFKVDEVVEELEVLVKDLGKQLRRVNNLAGCTVLGSGKVVPILHVRDLLRTATTGSMGNLGATDDPRQEGGQRKSILVVEDSITSRTLLKNILEMAGYQVKTAVDGQEGLSFLKHNTVDLVISDIEMPRMSGLELTVAIRADSRLTDLPVILVTTLSSREDRERGIDAGANAYMVKSNFDQSNLLEIIGKFI